MAKTETKIIEIKIQGLDGFNEIAKHVEQIEIAEKEIKKLKYETDELGKSVKRSMTTQDKNKVAEYTTTIKMHRREIGVLSREVISSFKADQQKIGHIEKLEAEVQSLTLQYRKLTEAQLNDANVGGKMLVNLKKKREELQGMKQAYGDYGMAVGNYGTATKMLGINIGQVMKEMPNFAISARTGIMSLSNNLPMLGEAIQYVRIEQQKLIAAGKEAPSMFSLISKSVFGLTGILSIGTVLLTLYGAEIIKWVSSLFKAKDATAGLDEANKNLNKTLKEGKSFYTTASTEIATLENNLRLAEKGLIDSEVVLNKYNTALGDSFGKAESLSEALSKITQIKQDYIEGLVAMTAAHDILSIAIDKSADALALERQGKPGFFGYVKQYGRIILDSFDPKNWGLMALPNTLNRIANVGTETYQAFYDNIDKLRAESQKGVQAYDDEVSRITQKYKDDPFMLKLLGLDSGKGGTSIDTDYKNTQEWKDFSARYDAMREQMKMEEDLQKHQYMVLRQLQESFSETKAEKERKEQERQQKIILNATKKTQAALARVLADETRQAFLDIDAQVENYMRKINAKVADADTILATAQLKGQATTQLQMNLLDEQEQLERLAATKRGESITAIEEYYAAKRAEIKRLEVESAFSSVASLFGSIAGLLEENSKGQKMAASAQALINTYLGASSAYAQTPGGVLVKSLAAAAAVAAGLVNVKKIWAVKTDVPDIKPEMSKKTVTEKFHSGGTIGTTTGEEKPITALTGESVNTIATTQMFSPILSALNQIGGGKAITSGVNTSMGTDMLAAAFSKALRQMPAPRIIWSDFETASERQRMIENNRLVR